MVVTAFQYAMGTPVQNKLAITEGFRGSEYHWLAALQPEQLRHSHTCQLDAFILYLCSCCLSFVDLCCTVLQILGHTALYDNMEHRTRMVASTL